jgi:zinc transporter
MEGRVNADAPIKSFVYAIDPDGKSRRLPPSAEHSDSPGAALLWRHIDGNDAECRKWLETRSGLSKSVIAALEATETRPRATPLRSGALVILRGVNENPDADPEDLVSIRLWVTARTVLSMNFRPLLAISDMEKVVKQRTVKDAGDFIVELAGVLTRRLDTTLDELSANLGVLEDDVIEERGQHLRRRIGAVRRTAIELRRYISPQRDALLQLANGPFSFFDDSDRTHLAEAAHGVTRIMEEIDSVRDQAAVLSDQLSDLRAETVGQRTLVLSIVAAVFLPLTYITGLIGMNVEGIPFAQRSWAFTGIVAVNLVLGAGILLWLYRRGWFR